MPSSQIYNHVITRLKKELPSTLYYHGVHHTIDVVNAVKVGALHQKIESQEAELLEIAAIYHDTGFLFQYDNNEDFAAQLAKEDLLLFNFDKHKISTIQTLICSTKLHQKPSNILEMILSDADFDYFGRDDFHEISETLRQELNCNGYNYSKQEWDKIQVEFLQNHTYYTDYAKQKRLPKKLDNLHEIKLRLKSY